MAFERPRPSRIALIALAVALSVTPHADAQEEVDSETRSIARELALQGADAFEHEDYATALDRFQRAATLFRAPTILVMLARSLASTGRFLEALDRYEETQRLPLPPDAPEAFRIAVEDARNEGRALRARLPGLELRTNRVDRPAGLSVVLDGRAVSDALLDVERPVDPGPHELAVTAPGFAPFHQEFALAEGEHRVIAVPRLTPLVAPRAPRPAPPPAPSPHASSAPGRPWAYVLGGVGIASVGAGVATGVVALNRQSELDAQCHPGCPEQARDALSSYRANRTLSYVTFGVGAVALGAGAYLWFKTSPQAAPLAAGVSPNGLSLRGAF